jgi:hypothetical protein
VAGDLDAGDGEDGAAIRSRWRFSRATVSGRSAHESS